MDRLQQTYSDRMTFSVYKNANASAEIGEFANSQGVQFVPTMMLVSPEGVELMRWVGARSESELRTAFDANL